MQTQVAADNPEMQLPLIHLNGNDGSKLGHQYLEALKVVGQLENAFLFIEFHARDYYPLGDEAWLKARAQREVMHANIRSLRNYLDVHAGHCFEAAR